MNVLFFSNYIVVFFLHFAVCVIDTEKQYFQSQVINHDERYFYSASNLRNNNILTHNLHNLFEIFPSTTANSKAKNLK